MKTNSLLLLIQDSKFYFEVVFLKILPSANMAGFSDTQSHTYVHMMVNVNVINFVWRYPTDSYRYVLLFFPVGWVCSHLYPLYPLS